MKKNKYFDIVAIISIIFICLGFTIKIIPNDTFYTIKIGELILENGIDMKDHFSWISNLPYTYPHWLYDVIMSVLYKIRGFSAIYCLNIIFYSIIGILIYQISKERTKNYVFSFILTIMAIGFLSPFITARAQVISFIIFIIEKYFLDKFLENGKFKNAIMIILMSLLLVNMHLATWIFFFVLFLPPIVSHYITLLIMKIRKTSSNFNIGRISFKTNDNVPKLFLIIVACLLTGFITPLGLTPFTYVFNQFAGDTLDIIQEYNNITISNCFSFFQIISVLSAIFLLTKEKIELSDLFLLLGLILMSLVAIRSLAYFIIIGSFAISNYIGKANKRISDEANKKLDYIFNKKSELLVILLCFVTVGVTLFYFNNTNDFYDDSKYPIKATEFIKKKLNTNDIRIFNEYYVGSYLLYNDIDVFIDSRSDLYTTPFNKLERDIFNDYVDVINNLNYEEVFNYYQVTHILLKKDNLLIKILSSDENYQEIYSDNYFIILERNNI